MYAQADLRLNNELGRQFIQQTAQRLGRNEYCVSNSRIIDKSEFIDMGYEIINISCRFKLTYLDVEYDHISR